MHSKGWEEATPDQTQAAGLTLTAEPAQKEVTAACEASLPHDAEPGQHAFVDFAHVKAQLPIARVLEHLNLTRKLQKAAGALRSSLAAAPSTALTVMAAPSA